MLNIGGLSVNCGRSVVSSVNKTDRHDITEILLKLALSTKIFLNIGDPTVTMKSIKAMLLYFNLCLYSVSREPPSQNIVFIFSYAHFHIILLK